MIYLDSAATTLQKPPQVAAAMYRAMQEASSPGRGGHPWGSRGAEIAFSCRDEAAKLFRVPAPEQVVFTFNATHGLNIAIHGLVKPGSKVLISGYEHNAVTRPLHAIPNVEIRVASASLFDSAGILESFAKEIARSPDVVICTHVSNVFGFILPIEQIAALCRAYNVPLIIDASQSAGCVPINFTDLGAQYIAMPGHKGLYGPQGTGILLCAKGCVPLIQGGTGSVSRQREMPDFLPDQLEAGTPNIPGIAGLREGLRFVARRGVGCIGAEESGLIRLLGNNLRGERNLRVFLSHDPGNQSGVLSAVFLNRDCEAVGEWLGEHGVGVRAGLHCAPTAHQSAGTLDCGTVRFSVSCFNTPEEINRVSALFRTLAVQEK